MKNPDKSNPENEGQRRDGNLKNLIEEWAENLSDFYPLPNITPLQKLLNSLYVKLRICGLPADEASKTINCLLQKHGIKKHEILPYN